MTPLTFVFEIIRLSKINGRHYFRNDPRSFAALTRNQFKKEFHGDVTNCTLTLQYEGFVKKNASKYSRQMQCEHSGSIVKMYLVK